LGVTLEVIPKDRKMFSLQARLVRWKEGKVSMIAIRARKEAEAIAFIVLNYYSVNV